MTSVWLPISASRYPFLYLAKYVVCQSIWDQSVGIKTKVLLLDSSGLRLARAGSFHASTQCTIYRVALGRDQLQF